MIAATGHQYLGTCNKEKISTAARLGDIKGPISAVPRQKNVTNPYVTAVVDYRTDVVPSPLISTSVSSNLSVNGCIVWTLNFGAFGGIN